MIGREEVEHVARLARLHLEEDEVEGLQGDLSKIIDYVRQIGELDLTGVEPTAHAAPLQNVFRADEAWEGLNQEQALENAPETEEGYFVVPRMG